MDEILTAKGLEIELYEFRVKLRNALVNLIEKSPDNSKHVSTAKCIIIDTNHNDHYDELAVIDSRLVLIDHNGNYSHYEALDYDELIYFVNQNEGV